MLKKLAFVAFLMLPFTFASAQTTTAKIGHINTQELINLMPDKAAAEKKLETSARRYESELVKMNQELEKKYTSFMAEADTLPEAIKTRRMQEVQELQTRVQTFQQTASQSLQKEQQTLFGPIMEKVTKAIKDVAAEQKFDYILDMANSNVLYASPTSLNILDAVKKKLGLQ